MTDNGVLSRTGHVCVCCSHSGVLDRYVNFCPVNSEQDRKSAKKLSKCNCKGKPLLEQMEEMDRICPSRLQAAVSQMNVHTIVAFVNLLGPAFSLRPETALDTR